jgi:hypothetical protein
VDRWPTRENFLQCIDDRESNKNDLRSATFPMARIRPAPAARPANQFSGWARIRTPTLQVAGRLRSLFFWRDRTREADFVVDIGGRLELFEAKWTEVPTTSDAVNLNFVRHVVGEPRIAGGAIICRTSNSFPMADGLRACPCPNWNKISQTMATAIHSG